MTLSEITNKMFEECIKNINTPCRQCKYYEKETSTCELQILQLQLIKEKYSK